MGMWWTTTVPNGKPWNMPLKSAGPGDGEDIEMKHWLPSTVHYIKGRFLKRHAAWDSYPPEVKLALVESLVLKIAVGPSSPSQVHKDEVLELRQYLLDSLDMPTQWAPLNSQGSP